MGRVSNRDVNMLDQLVRDCISYGLSENESLEYIEKRSGGMKISRSNLYNRKGRISKNEKAILDERLVHHGRIGYALKHFKFMDDIECAQKILFQSILEESNQPREKKNLFLVSRIATNILENTKFLRILNIDVPFVERMKTEFDELRKNQRPSSPVKREPDPPTSLTIPFDSIAGKPTEKYTNPSGDDDEPVFE
jgi:hypothetical protein